MNYRHLLRRLYAADGAGESASGFEGIGPMNPMVDSWMGDDWFHNGAFREFGLAYIYEQEATRDNSEKFWNGYQDDYDLYMQPGSASELAQRHCMEQGRNKFQRL